MKIIAVLLLILFVLSLVTFVITGTIRIREKKRPPPKQFEPDLSLVDKPNLIAKIPENENKIPDATGPENK